MRRYTLNPTSATILSNDWTSYNYSERKVFDILTGLALGILSDGEITEKEAIFLAKWIESNSRAIPEKFIRNLLPVIRLAGAGKDLSDKDLNCITKILESIAFGETQTDTKSPCVSTPSIGAPCALVFDDIHFSEIKFDGIEFIFTGNFSTSSKKDLMDRTARLGALAKSATPTRDTHYVVVGSKGSDQWAYSGLGRKLEHALKLKESYSKLSIIREEVLIQALTAAV